MNNLPPILFAMRRRVLAICLLGVSSLANAETITAPVYDSVSLITRSSLTVTHLALPTAGTLQVQLTDLAWPDLAQSLSFALSEPSGVLAKLNSPGELSYEVSGPMTLFASVYAAPNASAKAVLYRLKVTFTSGSPVPLPAGIWLLFSGMAGLSAIARKRRVPRAPHPTVACDNSIVAGA